MKTLLLKGVLFLVAVATTAAALLAQIDPQNVITITQNGMPAGIIFVPDRAPGTAVYAEHWVLFPNYANPSAANGAVTELVPMSELNLASEAEFFRAAPWGPGYRYVRTLSYDTATLPGR